MSNHPYHIVEPSPWPISVSALLFFLAISFLAFIKGVHFAIVPLILSLVGFVICLIHWWGDIIDEGLNQQKHNSIVATGLKIGVKLVIVSEIMFFIGFFVSILKNKFLPIYSGLWANKLVDWAPSTFEELDPFGWPLTNTLLLLLSAKSLEWGRYALSQGNTKDLSKGLRITIILGIIFLSLQINEYASVAFKITDGVITSDFYVATGFHGLHVLIGVIFLVVCYFRTLAGHFDNNRAHLNIEFASWYWHFVDIVWRVLFVVVYLI